MKRLFLTLAVCAVCLMAMGSRPKIGLALGGGGAKGAAEVGVLKVIEQAGIPVDYIAGTSIGSIVGGLYAAGYSAAELDTMFQTQEWLSLLTDRRSDYANDPYKEYDGVTYVFGFPVMDSKAKGVGMMRGERIEQLLDSMVSRRGCTGFDNLKIPFRCVAADIRTAEEVVLKKGNLAHAMRASMAIPGIFKPVSTGDWLLVDGGMMNNLPVDVCRAMGADIVIAVDLQQNEKKPRKTGDTSFLSVLGGMLGIGSLLNWIAERPDVEKYFENVKQADIYIHPDLPDQNATSFGNKSCARMITIGEETARKHWDELVRLR